MCYGWLLLWSWLFGIINPLVPGKTIFSYDFPENIVYAFSMVLFSFYAIIQSLGRSFYNFQSSPIFYSVSQLPITPDPMVLAPAGTHKHWLIYSPPYKQKMNKIFFLKRILNAKFFQVFFENCHVKKGKIKFVCKSKSNKCN